MLETLPPLSRQRVFKRFFQDVREDFTSCEPSDRTSQDAWYGTFLQIDGGFDRPGLPYQSAKVKPTEFTKRLCRKNMMGCGGSLHYKMVLFQDEATLYAVYDQIIGSRLLATIDLNTLPKWVNLVPDTE